MRRSRPRESSGVAQTVLAQLDHGQRGVVRFAPFVVLVVLLAASWVLGGASQNNALFVAILELVAIAGLGVILFWRGARPMLPPEGRTLLLLLAAFAGLVALQLVPLPWEVWSALPGHQAAADATRLLDLPKTFHPLSLTPENTISGALKFIPAIAIFLAALALPWRVLFATIQWGATLAGVISSVLGLAQVLSGASGLFHVYNWANFHVASGFFSNQNNQAIFLLMCLPFLGTLMAQALSGWRSGRLGVEFPLLLATAGFVVLCGIAIAGSLTGYILAPFVVAGCAMLAPEQQSKVDPKYFAGGLALTAAAIALALSSPQLRGVGEGNYFGGERARSAIHQHTLEAAIDFLPLGSGLGSFQAVYPFYEREGIVERSYVNHAHNEYLEVLLEAGIPGLAIVLVFLVWWIRKSVAIWLTPDESMTFRRTRMAATIATAVVLIHSLLEFSIRTPTISAMVVVCLAIVVRRRSSARSDPGTALVVSDPQSFELIRR